MANQPKAYKKFVATAATATLVASAIAPVAMAAPVDSFKDVSKDYKEAVNYLLENNIAQGTTETTFGTSSNISRGDAAVMIAKALKLDTAKAPDAGFQDVNARVAGAVNAIVDAKIASGKTATSFAPADYITRQEMAKMLANAYKLTAKENANFKDVNSNWIGYVSALKEAGITLGKTETTFAPTANLSRGEFALFVYRAEVEVTPAPPVVTTATKVESVSATNLKEVVVAFDGKVDAATAENEENYSLASGSIDTAELAEDGKTVVLTLVGTLGQQQTNKLTVKGVKAGDKVVEVKDFEFTPLDNTLPTVEKVEALGNKAIKVTYSEPIKTSTSLNYKLDGKSFYGTSNQGSAVVILTPFDSTALSVGEHTLTSQNVVDYNDLKSLISENKFAVVEDKVAPTMTNVEATLEKVTVTFSEDIDPATLDNSKVYWMNGTTKYRAASNKNLGNGKFTFDFSANPLPGYETTLYVEGVKDYSGNAMTDTTIAVKATVDQTRPEVVQVKAASDRQSFTVKFNKKVQGVAAKHFTVTDKDGKVRSISNVGLDAAGTTATVSLYAPLPEGTNTVKVSGIQDATTLKNTMLDYSTTFVVGDTTAPSIATSSSNGATRQVIVTFSEKMDVSTIADPSNYLVTFAGSVRTLPAGTEIAVIQDQKAVMFTFPEKIGDVTTTFGAGGLTSVKVLGVKDVVGNLLSNFTNNTNDVAVSATDTVTAIDYSVASYGAGYKAVVTDKNTIKLKLNKGIASSSNKTGVTVAGYTVDKVIADGSNVVTIKTVEDMDTDAAPAITVAATNGLTTVTGSPVNTISVAGSAVIDQVAPEVVFAPSVTNYIVTGSVITVNFSETLAGTVATGGDDDYYAHDLIVTRVSDNKVLKANVDYTTTLTGTSDGIAITLQGAANGSDSKYTVEVVDNARYILDTSAVPNYAKAKGAVVTNTSVDLLAISATPLGNGTTVTIAADATATITFSEAVPTGATGRTAVETALTSGAGANPATYNWNAAGTVLTLTGKATTGTTFAADVSATVIDAAGNSASVLLIDAN